MRSPDGYIFENVHPAADPGEADPEVVVPPRPTEQVPDAVDEVAAPSVVAPHVHEEPVAAEARSGDESGSDDISSFIDSLRHRWQLIAAGLVGVLVAVSATFVLPGLFDDGGPNTDPSPSPSPTVAGNSSQAPSPLPTEAADVPRSAPLRDSQILVGAGDDPDSQNIWLVDVDNPSATVRLTTGASREWLPSLSPDRRTMAFSRADAGVAAPFELWLAEAGTGSDERRLFENGVPDVCRRNISRPAWLPGDSGQLVARCIDREGVNRLVVLDTSGNVMDRLGSGPSEVASFGDPAASSDGRSVIVWGNPEVEAWGGSLYAIDLTTGNWLKVLSGKGQQFSDPAFSPDGSLLTYRDDAGGGDFQVAVATVARGQLKDPRQIVTSPGRDQDPMFSPDGSQIVYGHIEPGARGKAQELRIIDAAGETEPQPFELAGLPVFQSVPAWSRR